jgi:hypothetical protein
MASESHHVFSWRLMRYSYGAVVFLAGLDKVLGTNIITDWPKYVSPFVAHLLPMSVGAFIVTIGVVELVVGVMTFTRFTLLASYLSVAWLVVIAINLLMIGGYVDIAIRDLLLAVGALATSQLAAGLGYTLTGKQSGTARVTTHAQTA